MQLKKNSYAMESSQKRNIKPFNGEKYAIWKFRVKSLLSELGVLSVIEEEIPTEPNQTWLKRNCVARNTIIEYISDSLLHFAKNNPHAKDIIEEMDAIFERKSLATQLACRKKLLTLKLDGSTPLTEHFTKFDEIVTELIGSGGKMDEMDKISHLLTTLPNSYAGVITALETLSDDKINVAFVKTRLLDHEVKLKEETATLTGMKILNVKSTSATNKNKKHAYKFNKKRQHFNNDRKRFQKHRGDKFANSKTFKSNIRCDHC